jgi:hypothetical protein
MSSNNSNIVEYNVFRRVLEIKLFLKPLCKHSPKLQVTFEFGAP